MSSKLFEERIHKLDRKFERPNRKALLIVDDCPAYWNVSGFKTIDLCFLPANTTSITQPIDQDVIRYLKAKSYSQMNREIIKVFDASKGSILDALRMLTFSLEDLTFAKSRTSIKYQNQDQNDLQ